MPSGISDPISSAVGIGLGLVGSIGKMFGNAKANRELRTLQANDPNYATSSAGMANNKLASGRLGLAQTLLNARMPGAQTIERNIYGTQANTTAGINRNATDSATALALQGGVQGQTNQAFNQLGLEEKNNYQQNYQNLVGAQEGMMNENDRAYQDQVRRFGDQAQIGGQINQNRQNTWSSISNLGFGIADIGANGGFGGGSSSGGQGMSTGMGWNPARQGFNSSGRATGTF